MKENFWYSLGHHSLVCNLSGSNVIITVVINYSSHTTLSYTGKSVYPLTDVQITGKSVTLKDVQITGKSVTLKDVQITGKSVTLKDVQITGKSVTRPTSRKVSRRWISEYCGVRDLWCNGGCRLCGL